jgi:hypothetical protein
MCPHIKTAYFSARQQLSFSVHRVYERHEKAKKIEGTWWRGLGTH